MSMSKRILALRKKESLLKVAILDDDPDDIDYLKHFVQLTDGVRFVYSANDPEDMLAYLKTEVVDVLLLDMEMPVIDGLLFLPQLRSLMGRTPRIAQLQVIVCSAHGRFALEGFNYKVTDYLTKPIVFDRYLEAIHEVKQRLQLLGRNTGDEVNDCLTIVSAGGEIIKVAYEEILYIEATEDKSRIWISSTQYYEANERFGRFLQRMPQADFVQVHRSYAVALKHFLRIKRQKIQLRHTVKEIKAARKGSYKRFDDWLAENAVRGYLKEEPIPYRKR